MNDQEILRQQNQFLSDLEREYGILPDADSKKPLHLDMLASSIPAMRGLTIPEIPDLSFNNWKTLEKNWPTVEYDLFPRWRVADIPVMIMVGFLGALLSQGLHDVFKDLHDDKWGRSTFEQGGHSGETADKIRGLFHRLKHGHDLFNPGEIDWNNYFSYGNPAASMGTKVFAWLRHMFQDTFSTEGLPLPGHSYLRDTIRENILGNVPGMTSHEVYKTFFTIKMRDVSAAGFVPLAMTAYVFGTEIGNKRKFFNYRYTSLTIGALAVSILLGMAMPKPSFNHASLVAIIPYMITLWKVDKRVHEQLIARDRVIALNESALSFNRESLMQAYGQIDGQSRQLESTHLQMQAMIKRNQQLMEACTSDCVALLSDQNTYLTELELKY